MRATNGTGHLWQARFGPVAMDEDHLIAAISPRLAQCASSPVEARGGLAVVESVRAHSSGLGTMGG